MLGHIPRFSRSIWCWCTFTHCHFYSPLQFSRLTFGRIGIDWPTVANFKYSCMTFPLVEIAMFLVARRFCASSVSHDIFVLSLLSLLFRTLGRSRQSHHRRLHESQEQASRWSASLQ